MEKLHLILNFNSGVCLSISRGGQNTPLSYLMITQEFLHIYHSFGILKKSMGIIQIDEGDTWTQEGKTEEGMLV